MNSKEKQTEDKTQARKLLMSAFMLLVATGIFGGFFYLQKQSGSADAARLPATLEEAMKERAAKRGMIYDSKTKRIGYPDLTPDEQEAFVIKLKLIREKWRPWAEKNQGALKKLLRAQAGDEATLMSVYQALPAKKSEIGLSSRDLIPSKDLNAALQARLPAFTWQLLRPGSTVPEKLRAEYEKTQISARKLLQEDFKRMRDIRLSRSIYRGEPNISLWASGRITIHRRVHEDVLTTINGKSSRGVRRVDEPYQEITPPYEFLR